MDPQGVMEDDRVRALLRALVRRVHELGPSGGVPLLDTEELGVRCLLLPMNPEPVDVLSPREREIARMVGLGHTNKMIAAVLEISLYTVSTHLRRIFAKLDVSTRAAMVAVLSDNHGLPKSG
ncbi:helix-turn-helix transcriptional regulator [Lentzea tibetensis]|uniref:Helix-turn-helix transcriptional regulator n=1 Tax=Lentzea tibetensis TaxID=2591470 RepID=A0A563EVV5_9PSEU|nr:helix-turn-helix transcriptional regulator [Lentzea tibetensis]TWP51835.1 helix-turn-helix transcriptional regulator [Lentzea tibetensis]